MKRKQENENRAKRKYRSITLCPSGHICHLVEIFFNKLHGENLRPEKKMSAATKFHYENYSDDNDNLSLASRPTLFDVK